ncbi:hypothetical protein BpHYR1_006515 [Brachionus plicatilis]|uniref:Uncharacterized protein n=1 Tax=Brachionus plicatilis TaxID=10195 RepID=A0A3M7R8K3_BRAPC|nr:hypothetical protein BpHYR1_006515 [Brachionus plicatilis]
MAPNPKGVADAAVDVVVVGVLGAREPKAGLVDGVEHVEANGFELQPKLKFELGLPKLNGVWADFGCSLCPPKTNGCSLLLVSVLVQPNKVGLTAAAAATLFPNENVAFGSLDKDDDDDTEPNSVVAAVPAAAALAGVSLEPNKNELFVLLVQLVSDEKADDCCCGTSLAVEKVALAVVDGAGSADFGAKGFVESVQDELLLLLKVSVEPKLIFSLLVVFWCELLRKENEDGFV